MRTKRQEKIIYFNLNCIFLTTILLLLLQLLCFHVRERETIFRLGRGKSDDFSLKTIRSQYDHTYETPTTPINTAE